MALKRSIIIQISAVENHLYVHPAVHQKGYFCMAEVRVTFAYIWLVEAMSTSTTESFKQSSSVLAERRNFGARWPRHEIDVRLRDIAISAS